MRHDNRGAGKQSRTLGPREQEMREQRERAFEERERASKGKAPRRAPKKHGKRGRS